MLENQVSAIHESSIEDIAKFKNEYFVAKWFTETRKTWFNSMWEQRTCAFVRRKETGFESNGYKLLSGKMEWRAL